MQHDQGQVEHVLPHSIWDFLAHLLDADFPSRGSIVGWQPEILWLHVLSDALIALAFYSIPLAILYDIRRKPDLSFLWVHGMFALFLLACGTTHLLNAAAFWYPMYRLDGLVKAITGVLSVATAISLWPLIPRALALRNDAGAITGITGVNVDITERKRAEQHKAFLLAELDHRVKNNLSVVLALAEESLRASGSLEDCSRAFVGRVRALAKTHAALAASRWEGVKLGDLIDLTLESYMMSEAPDGVERVMITGESIRLSPRAASALCMTINELVTNAAKYGAFSVHGGRVTIQWVRRPEAGEHDVLHLEWQESGGPPVSPPDHRGLGTQLIEEGVAYEMGGVVRTEYRPEGVLCIVEFPLSDQNTRRGCFEEAVGRAGDDA